MISPNWRGTAILLGALFVAALTIGGSDSAAMAGKVAWIAGVGLGSAFAWEAMRRPPREWFRIDWAALATAYYLTLAEFLFPQPQFSGEVDPDSAASALRLVLAGLAALAIGRHLAWPARADRPWPNPSRREWLALLIGCFALGHLHMFLSVGFNPVTLIREMLGPRFSQPWARERLGDSRALLSELQLLNYLIPPLTAWLIVQTWRRPWQRLVIALPLVFLLFASFCGGTRYVLATHVATFAVALAWTLPELPWRRALLLFGIPLAAVLFITVVALQFRHQGLSQKLQNSKPAHAPPRRFIVDNNLRTIARLTETFPAKHGFLGTEVPLHILVRPLPRAFFPAKPEKLSLSMEEIAGIPQTSIASTFVGEGFIMAGWRGSVAFGLILGALCACWNRIPVLAGSASAIILYASGFHWALLTARSPIWLSIGFLPCLAFVLVLRVAFPVARSLLPAQGATDHGPPRL